MNGENLADAVKSHVKAGENYSPVDYCMAGNYFGYIPGVAETAISDESFHKYRPHDDLCRKKNKMMEVPDSFFQGAGTCPVRKNC